MSTVSMVVMYEVFFAAVCAAAGLIFGGPQLAAAGLFFGSLLGLALGLMQR